MIHHPHPGTGSKQALLRLLQRHPLHIKSDDLTFFTDHPPQGQSILAAPGGEVNSKIAGANNLGKEVMAPGDHPAQTAILACSLFHQQGGLHISGKLTGN